MQTLLHGRRRLMACPWCPSQCWRWSLRSSTFTLGWMNSADGGPGRKSTLGGGSCTTPLLAWSGGTSPGCCGVCPSLYNDRFWGVLLSHASVYGGSWKNFCIFHALFTLGNMVHYFLLVSYLAVTRLVSGCCL